MKQGLSLKQVGGNRWSTSSSVDGGDRIRSLFSQTLSARDAEREAPVQDGLQWEDGAEVSQASIFTVPHRTASGRDQCPAVAGGLPLGLPGTLSPLPGALSGVHTTCAQFCHGHVSGGRHEVASWGPWPSCLSLFAPQSQKHLPFSAEEKIEWAHLCVKLRAPGKNKWRVLFPLVKFRV